MTEAQTPDETNKRILVVDDDPAVRLLLRSILGTTSFTIGEAQDGAEAKAQLEHDDVGLVFLDIYLPDMQGWDILSIMKQRRSWRQIPVVAITGDDSDEMEERLKQSEFNAYIIKPLAAERVLDLADFFTGATTMQGMWFGTLEYNHR